MEGQLDTWPVYEFPIGVDDGSEVGIEEGEGNGDGPGIRASGIREGVPFAE